MAAFGVYELSHRVRRGDNMAQMSNQGMADVRLSYGYASDRPHPTCEISMLVPLKVEALKLGISKTNRFEFFSIHEKVPVLSVSVTVKFCLRFL